MDFSSSVVLLFLEYRSIWRQVSNIEELAKLYSTILKDGDIRALNSQETLPLIDNSETMDIIELKCSLISLRQSVWIQFFGTLSRGESVTTQLNAPPKHQYTDKEEVTSRLELLDRLIASICQLLNTRIEATRNSGGCLPRIVRLCDIYEFNDVERNVFYFAVVVLGSRKRSILSSFLDDDHLRRTTGLQRVGGMSEVDMETFCNSERQHIKEGVVIIEEDQGVFYNLRVPRTAVQLFYGRSVKPDDMLIVAQTCIEEILSAENSSQSAQPIISQAVIQQLTPNKRQRQLQHQDISDYSPSDRHPQSSEDDCEEYHNDIDPEHQVDIDTSDDADLTNVTNLQSYSSGSQLEYLEDGFSLIGLLVRSNAARIKDDMKKEGTRLHTYWDVGEVKQGRRELQAKILLSERRIEQRVSQSIRDGIEAPRLEILSLRLGLDAIERKIILLLIGKIVSPVVRTLIDTLDTNNRSDEGLSVGQVLGILCQDFATQIAYRRYFYKSSKLMSNGVISLGKSRWHQGKGDLTEQRVQLDRRILDWTVGLDSEINELVEGSDLYEPTVDLSQLVLPSGHLDRVLQLSSAYDAFLSQKKCGGYANKISYGNSLVVLLCGKPGTGKTMTVNAVAKHLAKKVLLVDFGALVGRPGEGVEVDLRGLFREASMNNAVIFFDECEGIFKSRGSGGDRMLNTMLTEIEKYSGIVFLATNLAYELDEAMHRRITCVIEYRPPDHDMRRRIWETLLGGHVSTSVIHTDSVSIECKESQTSLTNGSSIKHPTLNNPISPGRGFVLSSDVDIASISVKYELTGGFIKNAVLAALLCALNRSKENPVVTQEDLIAGCRLQMRGSLIQRSFEDKIESTCGLSAIHLNAPIQRACDGIIRFEKARAIIYNTSSSTSELKLEQKACIAAIVGPTGAGKKTIATSLAHDLNRSIKQLHIADVLTSSITDTLKPIRLVLQDARLADAVLILDGFEHVLEDINGAGMESSGSGLKTPLLLSRILDLLEQYPGLVILLCHLDAPQHLTLQRGLACKLFECIRCVIPTNDIRTKIWATLVPKDTPSHDLSFVDLGRRFELYPSGIASAITRGLSEASLRSDPRLKQSDLVLAAEAEIEKLKSGNFELISKMFT